MYRRRSGGWVKHVDFMLLDILCLQLSFVLAYWVRNGFGNPYDHETYRNIALLLTASDAIWLLMSSAVTGILQRGFWKEFKSCFCSMVLISLVSSFYLFAVQEGQKYSRLILIFTGVFYLLLNYLFRCIWKQVLRSHWGLRAKDSMLIAANREDMESVLDQVKHNSFDLPQVNGLILLDQAADEGPEKIAGIPVVADQKTMTDYICESWVDELLVVSSDGDICSADGELGRQLDEIAASGVAVHRVIGLELQNSGRTQLVEKYVGYTVLTDAVRIVSLREAMFKRFLDILGGLVGCILCGIALLIVGPIIYIQSPGPIIFKQKRVGRNGKIFTLYKIRSMVMDAERQKAELAEQNQVSDGMMFKLKFDPRIIGCKLLPDGTVKKGIGSFIRDWSIDELPQFFNVLKGDMSLVGTRPPTLDEWEKYQLHHRARMSFRPGVTGMWQVSGRSEITNFEDVVKLDMQYISGWDIGMDFRILLKTFKVVLGRKGAM